MTYTHKIRAWMAPGTLIAILALVAAMFTAWSDVKSDIAVGQEVDSQLEKKYENIDNKLDRIIEHMLRDKHGDNNNAGP